MTRTVILIFLIAFCCRARTDTKINNITFEGTSKLLPSELHFAFGLDIGDSYNHRKIETGIRQIRHKLIALGYLYPNIKQILVLSNIKLEITAGERYKIQVINMPYWHKYNIFKSLKENSIEQYKEIIETYFKARGYNQPSITIQNIIAPRRLKKKGWDRVIVITTVLGAITKVKGTEIVNANSSLNNELKTKLDEFVQSEKQSTSIFDPSVHHDEVIYEEKLFERAATYLKSYLRGNGYLNARVMQPVVINPTDSQTITLSYEVQEGELTLVENIRISPEHLSDPLMLARSEKLATLKDAPLSLRQIEDLRAEMEQNFLNSGYPFASVEGEVLASAAKGKADILFKTDLGEKVRIGKIRLQGNKKTHKDLILDGLKMSEGDLFSRDKLLASRSELMQLNVFDHIDLSLDDTSGSVRDLTINVSERARTTFEMGFGASVEDGPRVIGTAHHRNLFGRAIDLRGRAQINYPALFFRVPLFYSKESAVALERRFIDTEQPLRAMLFTEGKLSLSLEYPKISGFPLETRAAVNLNGIRQIRQAYTLNKGSVGFSTSSKPLPGVQFGPKIEGEYAYFDCALSGSENGLACGDLRNGFTKRLDQGSIMQATLGAFFNLDKRDNFIKPRKGFNIDTSADVGLGQGNLVGTTSYTVPIKYLKLSSGITGYLPLGSLVVFSNSLRAGHLVNLAQDGYVPLFKRFYLGGTSSVRGFSEDEIVPADSRVQLISLGGHSFVSNRAELSFPIRNKFSLGVFTDVGELLNDIKQFSIYQLAVGSGFGVRYDTPIGALAVDLGVRIIDGDRSILVNFVDAFRLHFSIGYT